MAESSWDVEVYHVVGTPNPVGCLQNGPNNPVIKTVSEWQREQFEGEQKTKTDNVSPRVTPCQQPSTIVRLHVRPNLRKRNLNPPSVYLNSKPPPSTP